MKWLYFFCSDKRSQYSILASSSTHSSHISSCAFARGPADEIRERSVRHRKSPWTDEDNHRLKTLAAEGVSVARAAVTFNRSIMSVRTQARKLGTPFPPVRIVRKKLAEAFSSDPR
jgi:hypothetical protein